jgi:hypothetical protein
MIQPGAGPAKRLLGALHWAIQHESVRGLIQAFGAKGSPGVSMVQKLPDRAASASVAEFRSLSLP